MACASRYLEWGQLGTLAVVSGTELGDREVDVLIVDPQLNKKPHQCLCLPKVLHVQCPNTTSIGSLGRKFHLLRMGISGQCDLRHDRISPTI